MQESYDQLCLGFPTLRYTDEQATEAIKEWFASDPDKRSPRELLLQYTSVTPFATKRHGATLLHMACEYHLVETFDYILSIVSEPEFLNKTMDNGVTALIRCQTSRRPHSAYMTGRLLQCGADLFARIKVTGVSALYMACEFHHLEAAKLMVDALVANSNDHHTIRGLMTRTDNDATALHASVAHGFGDSVVRWLTNMENRPRIWGWQAPIFGNLRYRTSAVMEAVRAERIDLPTIEYLLAFYGRAPILPTVVLNYHFGPQGMFHVKQPSTSTSTSTPVDTRRPADLYAAAELILRHTSTSTAPPVDPQVFHIVLCPEALRGILAYAAFVDDIHELAAAIRRIVAAYPPFGLPDVIYSAVFTAPKCARVMELITILGWETGSKPEQLAVYSNRTTIPADIVETYTARIIAKDQLDAAVLHKVMALDNGCTDYWLTLLHRLSVAKRKQALLGIIQHIQQTSTTTIEPLSINHICLYVRFIMASRSSVHISTALARCKDAHLLVPIFVRIGLLKESDLYQLAWGFVNCSPLAPSVMWHSEMLPTQLCARILVSVNRKQHYSSMQIADLVRDLRWVYAVRSMLQERGEGTHHHRRMILGPKHRAPITLPYTVTQLIIEFLWQGSTIELPTPIFDLVIKKPMEHEFDELMMRQ